ncbi:pre-mRNA 3' end processing protein WDR33-like [Cloeon dipterum]|uniref:pre-mRNA 3' end processing protein WDR33-like n=1 Tax=Cloeon dipterum TaxID=197152 RepID=UPI0032209986
MRLRWQIILLVACLLLVTIDAGRGSSSSSSSKSKSQSSSGGAGKTSRLPAQNTAKSKSVKSAVKDLVSKIKGGSKSKINGNNKQINSAPSSLDPANLNQPTVVRQNQGQLNAQSRPPNPSNLQSPQSNPGAQQVNQQYQAPVQSGYPAQSWQNPKPGQLPHQGQMGPPPQGGWVYPGNPQPNSYPQPPPGVGQQAPSGSKSGGLFDQQHQVPPQSGYPAQGWQNPVPGQIPQQGQMGPPQGVWPPNSYLPPPPPGFVQQPSGSKSVGLFDQQHQVPPQSGYPTQGGQIPQQGQMGPPQGAWPPNSYPQPPPPGFGQQSPQSYPGAQQVNQQYQAPRQDGYPAQGWQNPVPGQMPQQGQMGQPQGGSYPGYPQPNSYPQPPPGVGQQQHLVPPQSSYPGYPVQGGQYPMPGQIPQQGQMGQPQGGWPPNSYLPPPPPGYVQQPSGSKSGGLFGPIVPVLDIVSGARLAGDVGKALMIGKPRTRFDLKVSRTPATNETILDSNATVSNSSEQLFNDSFPLINGNMSGYQSAAQLLPPPGMINPLYPIENENMTSPDGMPYQYAMQYPYINPFFRNNSNESNDTMPMPFNPFYPEAPSGNMSGYQSADHLLPPPGMLNPLYPIENENMTSPDGMPYPYAMQYPYINPFLRNNTNVQNDSVTSIPTADFAGNLTNLSDMKLDDLAGMKNK